MTWVQTQFRSKESRIPTAVDVLLPQKRGEKLPVLYLLHDVGENQSYWIRRTQIEAMAEQYQTAVILPQGMNTFYMDTKNQRQVQSFLSEELPNLLEFWFGLRTDAKLAAIAGRGMGGFGAAYSCLKHPETFGFAAAFLRKKPQEYYVRPELAREEKVTPQWIWGEQAEWEALGLEAAFCELQKQGKLLDWQSDESSQNASWESVCRAEQNFLEQVLVHLQEQAGIVGREEGERR